MQEGSSFLSQRRKGTKNTKKEEREKKGDTLFFIYNPSLSLPLRPPCLSASVRLISEMGFFVQQLINFQYQFQAIVDFFKHGSTENTTTGY